MSHDLNLPAEFAFPPQQQQPQPQQIQQPQRPPMPAQPFSRPAQPPFPGQPQQPAMHQQPVMNHIANDDALKEDFDFDAWVVDNKQLDQLHDKVLESLPDVLSRKPAIAANDLLNAQMALAEEFNQMIEKYDGDTLAGVIDAAFLAGIDAKFEPGDFGEMVLVALADLIQKFDAPLKKPIEQKATTLPDAILPDGTQVTPVANAPQPVAQHVQIPATDGVQPQGVHPASGLQPPVAPLQPPAKPSATTRQ